MIGEGFSLPLFLYKGVKIMALTVNQLFEHSLALMSELSVNRTSYEEFVLPNVNTLMSELLWLQKAITNNDEQELPYLTNMSSVIPYDDRIILTCMNYGLARLLLLGDDEYSKSGFFNQEYIDSVEKLQKSSIQGVWVAQDNAY